MVKGWHFVNGDYHYYVGAPDVEAARKAVEPHDKVAAATTPASIPSTVVDFFGLTEGKVIFGKVFGRGVM